MARNINSIQRHIVERCNLPMVEAGLNLFDCPAGCSKPGAKSFYNVAPGQLVAYTIDGTGNVPVTIGAADIATTTGDIYIGIGWDADGDGVSDDVRLIAGEHLTKCEVDEATVGRPQCGNPGIKAAAIDCTECGETYTAKVIVDNNLSRSWGPLFKSGQEFTATYTTECCTCDDCPPEHNCKEVICGIVEALNGELDLKLGDRAYPDWKNPNLPRPFRAVRGHDNIFSYCITPDPAECKCDTCNKIDAVTSATIGGEAVDFKGNLDPTDPAKTLVPQLKNIAYQIECAFDNIIGKNTGFAVVTEGATACCPLQLHVVTCDPDFVIDGLTPCPDALELPFTITPVKTCVDCDTEPAEPITPTCWLAVIVDPPKPKCDDCYLDKVSTWYGADISLEFLKDGFACKPKVMQKTIMEASAPRNFGAYIMWLEYKYGFGPAGRGRRHRASNYRRGYLNKWDDTSRIKNAVTAKCDAMYCSYYLDHDRVKKSSYGPTTYCTEFRSGIHIPITHDVALPSWEEFFNALITANNGNCKIQGSLACIEEPIKEKAEAVKAEAKSE